MRTPPRVGSALAGCIGIASLGAMPGCSDPMMDSAYRDPGPGGSRHPPASSSGEQGRERRGRK